MIIEIYDTCISIEADDYGWVTDVINNDIIAASGPAGADALNTLYISDTVPVDVPTPYLWVQTNYQEPGGITIWLEDGE